MKPRYHLRFQIAPGPNLVADSQILADFCNQHNVEEVVLFVAAEELNNGLLSETEETQWFDTIRTAKQILENAGIVVSLNPWMTVLHTDRGRHFPPDTGHVDFHAGAFCLLPPPDGIKKRFPVAAGRRFVYRVLPCRISIQARGPDF